MKKHWIFSPHTANFNTRRLESSKNFRSLCVQVCILNAKRNPKEEDFRLIKSSFDFFRSKVNEWTVMLQDSEFIIGYIKFI